MKLNSKVKIIDGVLKGLEGIVKQIKMETNEVVVEIDVNTKVVLKALQVEVLNTHKEKIIIKPHRDGSCSVYFVNKNSVKHLQHDNLDKICENIYYITTNKNKEQIIDIVLDNREFGSAYSCIFDDLGLKYEVLKVDKETTIDKNNKYINKETIRMRKELLKEIYTVKGAKYTWGGSSIEDGFDCSGLVQYLYSQLEIDMPRAMVEQIKQGIEVDKVNLKLGDLVFFGETIEQVYHVGIYVGDGQIVHASQEGDVVKLIDVNEFDNFLMARRILKY